MKKLISVLLATSIYLSIYAIYPRNLTLHAADAAAQTDLESIVREQIEVFAKSIDQTDADTKASKALASHGISAGGKKLSVGKNHALTATLWNSEVMKAFLANSCANMIERMQTSGEDLLYVRGALSWTKFLYTYKIFQEPPKTFALTSSFLKTIASGNPYDTSLVWIVGGAYADVKLWKVSETANMITYSLDIITYDRFDFHTGTGSGFSNLISGIGALLFREFDWESKVSFQLTVPNECEHSYKTKTTKPTCTAKGYTTYTCTLCGCSYKADYTAKLSHKYDGETDGDCNTCGAVRFIRGDMNGDGEKNSVDAIYLLRHSIMAEQYPVRQSADVNGDGTVNGADAIYLLRHCIMPKEYPLG